MIEPVRSRCLCVRVAAPTLAEVRELLGMVAKKEGLALPDALADRLAAASNRDMRRAVMSLEVDHITYTASLIVGDMKAEPADAPGLLQLLLLPHTPATCGAGGGLCGSLLPSHMRARHRQNFVTCRL